MPASRRSAPEKSEDQKTHETVSILRAKIRRLEKLLKEAKRNECSCAASYSDESLSRDKAPSQIPQREPQHVICDCSAKLGREIATKEIDFVTHLLIFCTECAARKSIKKEVV